MYQLTFVATLTIALVATVSWAVLDRRRMVMTAVSTGTWTILAFGSGTITTFTETGAEITYEPAFFQYVCGFFAVISFFALWAVAWWENLPLARPSPSDTNTNP